VLRRVAALEAAHRDAPRALRAALDALGVRRGFQATVVERAIG
jgi:hypothetical protein